MVSKRASIRRRTARHQQVTRQTHSSACLDNEFVIIVLLTLSGEETIIEVQPADDSANIEGATDRIQLVVRSRNLGAYQYFSIGIHMH
jgi:hypothetical protein